MASSVATWEATVAYNPQASYLALSTMVERTRRCHTDENWIEVRIRNADVPHCECQVLVTKLKVDMASKKSVSVLVEKNRRQVPMSQVFGNKQDWLGIRIYCDQLEPSKP